MNLTVSDLELGDSLYSAVLTDNNIKLLLTVEWHEPSNNIEFSIKTLDMVILNTTIANDVEKCFADALDPYGITVNDIHEFAISSHYSTKLTFSDDEKKELLGKYIDSKCKENFKEKQISYNF